MQTAQIEAIVRTVGRLIAFRCAGRGALLTEGDPIGLIWASLDRSNWGAADMTIRLLTA